HGTAGGWRDPEQSVACLVRLFPGTGVAVRFALGALVPLRPGSTEHGLDLCGAHVAASGAGAASGAAAGARVAAGVTGVARTGVAGVTRVGAAGVSRLFLLLGALDDDLGLGFPAELLGCLLLLHLFAVDGLDLVDDLLRAVFAFGFDLGLTIVERIGLLGLDLGLDGLLILDRLVLDAVDGQHLAVGDVGGHRHGQEVV